MDDRSNEDIAYYFTGGRHNNIHMIVMCHKPAQMINAAKTSCDNISLTTCNGADLFKKFNETYNIEHKFYETINDLNSNY